MQSLPIYSTQAGGEFGSVCFVVCYAGTTETMAGTIFCVRTIDVIIWTGHGEQNQLEFIIVATNLPFTSKMRINNLHSPKGYRIFKYSSPQKPYYV